MSRSERCFNSRSPNEFIPERWLSEALRPPQVVGDHLPVSQPLGTDHSNGIGKNLAWAELRSVIARLVWALDIAEGGKRLDWAKLKTLTLMIIQKESIMVQLKIREGVDGSRRAA